MSEPFRWVGPPTRHSTCRGCMGVLVRGRQDDSLIPRQRASARARLILLQALLRVRFKHDRLSHTRSLLAAPSLGTHVKSEADYVRCRVIKGKGCPLSAKGWSCSVRSKLTSSPLASASDTPARALFAASAQSYARSFAHSIGARPQCSKVAI